MADLIEDFVENSADAAETSTRAKLGSFRPCPIRTSRKSNEPPMRDDFIEHLGQDQTVDDMSGEFHFFVKRKIGGGFRIGRGHRSSGHPFIGGWNLQRNIARILRPAPPVG